MTDLAAMERLLDGLRALSGDEEATRLWALRDAAPEMIEELRAARALIARLAQMLHEPKTLPDGLVPLGDRLVGAIDRLYREVHALKTSEHELLVLQRAWAPVVHAAVKQAEKVVAMTPEQSEAAEP